MRKATAAELMGILSEEATEFARSINEPNAHLAIPVDGKGLRIRVRVPRRAPLRRSTVVYPYHGEKLKINLEVTEDLQEYTPF
jgi:hypothetical protein